jgi:hypothetical protein
MENQALYVQKSPEANRISGSGFYPDRYFSVNPPATLPE